MSEEEGRICVSLGFFEGYSAGEGLEGGEVIVEEEEDLTFEFRGRDLEKETAAPGGVLARL